ncbi:MAG: CBS domain-containing protein [Alphaproteobacteria bacterium]|nr:MAG: CBS domain-containing protein [Alphaproteobacteria bacterium]
MSVRKLLEQKGSFVPSIRSNMLLSDVVDQLEADDAGALVVSDDDRRILGLISERDIVRGLKRYGRNVLDRPVRELMSTDVITCDIGEPLARVLELMDRHQIRHVPITREGDLCGIITMLDVAKYRLAELQSEAEALKSYVSGHG